MKFTVSDVVEMGHSKYIGGSVKIDLTFEHVVDPKPYLQIIDSLDHCLITDSTEMAYYSLRHFLIDESKNIFYDVCGVIKHMLKENNLSVYDTPSEITVTLCKGSLVGQTSYTGYPTVISYHIEG